MKCKLKVAALVVTFFLLLGVWLKKNTEVLNMPCCHKECHGACFSDYKDWKHKIAMFGCVIHEFFVEVEQ